MSLYNNNDIIGVGKENIATVDESVHEDRATRTEVWHDLAHFMSRS